VGGAGGIRLQLIHDEVVTLRSLPPAAKARIPRIFALPEGRSFNARDHRPSHELRDELEEKNHRCQKPTWQSGQESHVCYK
jgi:hypothetical protein